MSKNILMILAVIVTVLTGWLVIQVAAMDTSADVRGGQEAVKPSAQRPNGGSTVKVKTSVTVPDNDVDTSLNVR